MEIEERKILAIELCGNFSDQAASGRIDMPADPAAEYLDWVLSADVFRCAVIVPPQRKLKRGGIANWPHVTVSINDARNNQDELLKSANSGFELVLGANAELDSAIKYLGTLGYQESGRSVCGSGEGHDPLLAAWNKDNLGKAIVLATELFPKFIYVSAHDADPVYILQIMR